MQGSASSSTSRGAVPRQEHSLAKKKRWTKRLKPVKMVLNFDLNELPAESLQLEGDVAPIDMQLEQITTYESSGSCTPPINADAINNDLVLLPSSTWFLQAKYQLKRQRSIAMVLDENLETNNLQSGLMEEPVTTLSLSSQNIHTLSHLGRTIIGCDLNNNASEGCTPKVMRSKGLEPNHKETNLTCPVCLGALEAPSATICGHLFCNGCIETAITKQKRCPTCRKKLTKRNFHRIYFSCR